MIITQPKGFETKFVKLDEEESSPVVYRRCILVTCSMFMGYAALVTLQHRLKVEHDLTPHPPDEAAFVGMMATQEAVERLAWETQDKMWVWTFNGLALYTRLCASIAFLPVLKHLRAVSWQVAHSGPGSLHLCTATGHPWALHRLFRG